MVIWTVDHYEQNGDNPSINDHAQWFAREKDGKFYVGHLSDYDSEEIEVEGDIEAAKALVPLDSDDWPSHWLGPQGAMGWDFCLSVLNLEKVGESRSVTTDEVYHS